MRDGDAEATAALTQSFLDELRAAPLALLPERANEQRAALWPLFERRG